MVKALLIRAGIDKGTGGCLGPIYEDGSFEFIPSPLKHSDIPTVEKETYKSKFGRLSGYLPRNLEERKIHNDPEFDTFTFVQHNYSNSGKAMLKLREDDLIVFYAGLQPYPKKAKDDGLYIVGYFVVDKILNLYDFYEEPARFNEHFDKYHHKLKNNGHIKEIMANFECDINTVTGKEIIGYAYVIAIENRLVRGRELSEDKEIIEDADVIAIGKIGKLITKAIQLNGKDKTRPSREMSERLGLPDKSMQRIAYCRIISGENYIENLKEMLGIS